MYFTIILYYGVSLALCGTMWNTHVAAIEKGLARTHTLSCEIVLLQFQVCHQENYYIQHHNTCSICANKHNNASTKAKQNNNIGGCGGGLRLGLGQIWKTYKRHLAPLENCVWKRKMCPSRGVWQGKLLKIIMNFDDDDGTRSEAWPKHAFSWPEW